MPLLVKQPCSSCMAWLPKGRDQWRPAAPGAEGRPNAAPDSASPILHLADVGLQDKNTRCWRELPELFQGGQAIRRLLDSGQEITVLRESPASAWAASDSLASPPAGSSGFKCSMKLGSVCSKTSSFLKTGKRKAGNPERFQLRVTSGGCYFVVVCSLSFQVLQRSGIVGMNGADHLATFQFRTVAAGRHAFLQGALTNTAKAFTIHRFCPIHAAALTVDMLRQNGSMI